jgi:hypothetical protein
MKQLVLALFSLPTTEAASDPYDRNGKRYRIIQSWPRIRVLLQVKILACVGPGSSSKTSTSRHLPLCGLMIWPFRKIHFCAPVPLHANSWTGVRSAVPPPATSMHLDPNASVPMPWIPKNSQFHSWAKVAS